MYKFKKIRKEEAYNIFKDEKKVGVISKYHEDDDFFTAIWWTNKEELKYMYFKTIKIAKKYFEKEA